MIVEQYGVQQWRYEIVDDNIIVRRFADPFGDQCQRFLFDHVHRFDQGLIIHTDAIDTDRLYDVLRHNFVHIQHVQVDAAQLQHERMTECLACSHICSENAAQLLDGRHIFQIVNIFGRLRNDLVPHLVWQCHILFDECIFGRLVDLGGNHVADGFVEGVHLIEDTDKKLSSRFVI